MVNRKSEIKALLLNNLRITIVVYFYRYFYTTHVKMASILNYLIFLKINNKNLNGTYIQTGFCIFIFSTIIW
jgi:hypothetical protein